MSPEATLFEMLRIGLIGIGLGLLLIVGVFVYYHFLGKLIERIPD